MYEEVNFMFGVDNRFEDRSIVNIFIKEIGDGIVRDFVQDDFVSLDS